MRRFLIVVGLLLGCVGVLAAQTARLTATTRTDTVTTAMGAVGYPTAFDSSRVQWRLCVQTRTAGVQSTLKCAQVYTPWVAKAQAVLPPPPSPVLVGLVIGPKVVPLVPGETQFFILAPTWSDGAARAITPSWSATGGAMSGAIYTAGATAGTYRVIGSANGKADTATVTIAGTVPVPTPAPPPVPPPTPAPGPNALYFNSAEAGCGDANSLLCDDFEDGTWYEKNCDAANASGGLLQTDGWCGTIYGAASAPALCGNQGYHSNCAAQSSQAMYGDHSLAQPASDLYIRFYIKMQPGYTAGAEKMLTLNTGPAGVGGIWFGDLHMNCGGSSLPGAPAALQWQNAPNEPACRTITTLDVGTWYYIEIHVNTATKVLQFWVDDCGPFGAGCTGTPTLRLDLTGYSVLKSGTVGSLWFENWSNPSSSGIRLVDQIKVSRVGPIGFMQ